MLSPFPGFIPTGSGPHSSVATAALARRIRDEAGRYQPGSALERAVTLGQMEGPLSPSLFRYEIHQPGGESVVGLVGTARAADLVPHEGTVFGITDQPAPVVEIRPILALVDEPLPVTAACGPVVEVLEASGACHTLVAVEHGEWDLHEPVIADGHHRRRAVVLTRGGDASVLTMVVGDSGAGLRAGTFHRVFTAARDLPSDAGGVFEIEFLPAPAVIDGALVWLAGRSGQAISLRARRQALATMPEPLRESPAAVAQALLYPLLGVHENDALHLASWELAVEGVPVPGGALLLPDVEVGAVLGAARAGILLPPKASRFQPKPLRGLVLREVVGS